MYALKINNGEATITFGKAVAGCYPVLACSLADELYEFVFETAESHPSVENLDHSSDYATCFGSSSVHVAVDGCDLTRNEMRARNLRALKTALAKVRFARVDPGDI